MFSENAIALVTLVTMVTLLGCNGFFNLSCKLRKEWQ